MTGTQHDPTKGLLHGYCERCRAEWPCQYAPERNAQFQAEQRVVQLEGALRELQTILTASIVVGQYRETLLRVVQQALQPPAPTGKEPTQ